MCLQIMKRCIECMTKDMHVMKYSDKEVVQGEHEGLLPRSGEVHFKWHILLWVFNEWNRCKKVKHIFKDTT